MEIINFSPNTEVNIICITNYRLSCRQLSKNSRLSLSYFDFTGAADPVVFSVFFKESRIVRQRVLHSSTVKIERMLQSPRFSKALLLVLLLQTFVLLVLAIGTTMTIF